MSDEHIVQSRIRAKAGEYGIHLWRNNVGVLTDKRNVPVRFGLGNDSKNMNQEIKSSDLFGWFGARTICPGITISIEVKESGWRWNGAGSSHEQAQLRWIELVREAGGCAGFCASVEDFEMLVQEFYGMKGIQ